MSEIKDNTFTDCEVTEDTIKAGIITESKIKANTITAGKIVADMVDFSFTHCYEMADGRTPHAPGRKLIVGPPKLLEVFKIGTWKVVEIPEDNRDAHISVLEWMTEGYKRPISHKQALNGGLGCVTTQEDDGSFTRVHSHWCNLHSDWAHLWDIKDVTRGGELKDPE